MEDSTVHVYKFPRSQTASAKPPQDAECQLLATLPLEVLELVLCKLDSYTLAMCSCTCQMFRMVDKATKMKWCEKAAQLAMVRRCGPSLCSRWRHMTWIERLQVEETMTGFDLGRITSHDFTFISSPEGAVTSVLLEGVGPRMLVSDMSTADMPMLRWRLEVKGNNAVEFGVIPVSLQDNPKALHKCYAEAEGTRSVGFASAITVGSMLPIKIPIMKASVIEVLVRRSRLLILVHNPQDGLEMVWHNNATVPKPYKGPKEFRFEQDVDLRGPVKLALTCWARASFDVLHTLPRLPELPVVVPAQQVLQQQAAAQQAVVVPVAPVAPQPPEPQAAAADALELAPVPPVLVEAGFLAAAAAPPPPEPAYIFPPWPQQHFHQ